MIVHPKKRGLLRSDLIRNLFLISTKSSFLSLHHSSTSFQGNFLQHGTECLSTISHQHGPEAGKLQVAHLLAMFRRFGTTTVPRWWVVRWITCRICQVFACSFWGLGMGWKGVCNQGSVYGIGIWCYMYAYIWTDHFFGMWALMISLWNVFLISLNLSPWKNDFMPPKNNHHPSNRLDLHFYSIMWLPIFPDQKRPHAPKTRKKPSNKTGHLHLPTSISPLARSKQPTCPILLQGWPRTSLIINFLPRCRPGKLPYNFSKRWRWTSIFCQSPWWDGVGTTYP